mmetsp:Transcript_8380/g.10603  ORF Transcript_8380/g.10603 Transcript_8380/m.10603 type:complete len:570 (-) Transcript_8380:138-1847(-)
MLKGTPCLLLLASLLYSSEGANPNILVILADDVGTGEVPGYWNTGGVDMPNLEDLVSKGTVFKDVHSTPLCATSRYVLLSGNYQHRGTRYKGSWSPKYTRSQFKRKQRSLAKLLKNRGGYHTFMAGKWHLGGKVPTVDGFTPKSIWVDQKTILTNSDHNWAKPLQYGPQDIGFDSSVITTEGIQNPPYAFLRDGYFNIDIPSGVKYWNNGTYAAEHGKSIIKEEKDGEGAAEWDSTAYNMRLVNETKIFLDSHLASSDKPFFGYVALGSVHTPHSPPDKYIDGSTVSGKYPTRHMDLLGEMDKVVGSLVEALDERQLLEDTIIIFTSDNGGLGGNNGCEEAGHNGSEEAGHNCSEEAGHNGSGPLRDQKGSIYEGGHRVPLIMRWDKGNVQANQTRSHLVSLSDIYRTLTDIVGIRVPARQAIDSVSFANYIADENNTEKLRTYLGVWKMKRHAMVAESIRKDNYKLVRHTGNGTVELYDLDKDISESQNIITDNSALAEEMYTELKSFGPCHDTAKRFQIKKKNGAIVNTSCKWFKRKKTITRCENFAEGQIHCRLTCERDRACENFR